MPDDGIREDFPHIANTLAELIENKKIFPLFWWELKIPKEGEI